MDLPVIGHDRYLFGQVSMLNVTARVGVALHNMVIRQALWLLG
jgi:hypothetical protein